MTSIQPEPARGGTLHTIHARLGREYELAYNVRHQKALELHQDESLELLLIMREEATPTAAQLGAFTPVQRGSIRGLLDALDELIDDRQRPPRAVDH